ncbi:MAG TPA: hypothetical protein PK450_12970 [Paracoccaceae bacterium]|nr:hypothetical protein [Paracoccaceae bacterium]
MSDVFRIIALFWLISGNCSPAFAGGFEETVQYLEAGQWGWPDGDNTCEKNPQVFRFSADRATLTISWANTHDPAIYHLTMARRGFFVADIEGEDRLTDAGEPIRWMLLVTGSDSFCWHRMDWTFGQCTKNQIRCEAEDANS